MIISQPQLQGEPKTLLHVLHIVVHLPSPCIVSEPATHEECCPPRRHGLAMPSGVLYINAGFTATCTPRTSGGFLAASRESLHPRGDIRTAVHSCSRSYTRSNACVSTIYLSRWALFLHPRPFKSSFVTVTRLRVLVCMKWERWEQGSDGW